MKRDVENLDSEVGVGMDLKEVEFPTRTSFRLSSGTRRANCSRIITVNLANPSVKIKPKERKCDRTKEDAITVHNNAVDSVKVANNFGLRIRSGAITTLETDFHDGKGYVKVQKKV